MTNLQGSNEAGTHQNARYQYKLSAGGLLVENLPSPAASTNSVAATGSLHLVCQGLMAGDVVTGLVWAMVTAGSGLTLCRAGIYNKANQLIAQSLDMTAVFQGATGKVKTPLSAPLQVPVSDAYYGALILIGTTAPTLCRVPSQPTTGMIVPGASVYEYAAQTGQVDLPGTCVPTPAGVGWWQGVY